MEPNAVTDIDALDNNECGAVQKLRPGLKMRP
jgi:hypothetical protein